jgi:hypothetical protein
MGISIGFGLGPIRISSSLGGGGQRRRSPHRPIVTAQQYTEEMQRRAQYVAAQRAAARPAIQRPVTPRRPMSRWPLLLILTIPVTVALVFQVAMFAANGFADGMIWLLFQLLVVGIPVLVCRAIHCHSERARAAEATAARADYEHAQLCRGNIAVGTYGAFQPPHIGYN